MISALGTVHTEPIIMVSVYYALVSSTESVSFQKNKINTRLMPRKSASEVLMFRTLGRRVRVTCEI